MAAAQRVKSLQPSLKKFRYTDDDGSKDVLTVEQREAYEQLGFVVVPGLVGSVEIAAYRARFLQYCNGELPRPSFMVLMRDLAHKNQEIAGQATVTKAQDFFEDDVLFSYCTHPRVLHFVRAFTGPDIHAMHSMLINKPPNVGATGRHPFHQDLLYFPFRPADKIVASWTAMEPVSRENGCLVVLPGSHKGHLLEHGYPDWTKDGGVNKAYYGIKNLSQKDMDARVHLTMQAGDTVFFHPLLIHGSGANSTAGFRKAISCHYASAHCYYIDTHGTEQEEVAEEVVAMARRRFGPGAEVDFKDVWRVKGQLVAGKSDTL